MRQLPIETNPPEHSDYREIVEPIFRRAKDPAMIAQVEFLIDHLVLGAARLPSVEVVRGLALPLQSRALAYLLNLPETEAETWISWGTHVFRDGSSGAKKGAVLEEYLMGQFDRAEQAPGPDFFSVVARATYRGRGLSRAEMMGFANLAFAGGRDTIINTVSEVIAYCARHPGALEYLRQDPARIVHASEEFFRVISPLTHIGRVCPVETDVHGHSVPPGGRVSLCWAAANQDPSAFPAPGEVRLDRKPNPHVAFGFGAHLCLGAAHARLILRSLLRCLSQRIERVTLIAAREHRETEAAYERVVGFDVLEVKLQARSA
jgi:cytochrome P450